MAFIRSLCVMKPLILQGNKDVMDLSTMDNDTRKPLLTIAIPTYNRAKLLNVSLSQICEQLRDIEPGLIEVIVSNNQSSDETNQIISNFIAKGCKIVSVLNDTNIGAEKNVIQCFTLAQGKYVLIIGDDDILLDGSLLKLVRIIKNDDYGVVYLNSYPYLQNYEENKPHTDKHRHIIYLNHEAFIERVGFWVTFLSGNVVNKEMLGQHINPAEFVGTNIPQLNWILMAILKAKKNVFVEEYLIAYKTANTGGYLLCEVFGVNSNKIFKHFVAKGFNKKYFDIINRKLLQSFFPNLILISKRQTNGFNFISEKYFFTLYPIFKSYISFWLITAPVIELPLKIGSLWFRLSTRVLTFFAFVRNYRNEM